MGETLEQTAEKLFPTTTENDALNYQHVVMKSNWLKGAQIGVKWQQERSYSEEEVIQFVEFIFKNTLLVNVKGVEGVLEHFKNK